VGKDKKGKSGCDSMAEDQSCLNLASYKKEKAKIQEPSTGGQLVVPEV